MKKQKRVLREIYDVKKITIIVLSILVLFLLGYIAFVKDDGKDVGVISSNKEYTQINSNNDNICKIDYYRENNERIRLAFCYDGKLDIFDYNSDYAKEACSSNFVDPTLNISGIADVLYINNYETNEYYVYLLDKKGNVYTLSKENLLNENYVATLVENMKNIVKFDELDVYDKEEFSYNKNYYAVDKNGNIHLLAQ